MQHPTIEKDRRSRRESEPGRDRRRQNGDRRRSPRLHQAVAAWYRPGESHCIFQRSLAMSVGADGARLVTTEAIDERSDLHVTLRLQDSHITMSARTVWQRPLGNGGFLVGVRFDPLHSPGRQAFRRWYHRSAMIEQASRSEEVA